MIVRVVPPVFVRVTACDALVEFWTTEPKLRLVGFNPATGGLAEIPVPLRVTTCGVFGALSVIVSVPGIEPVPVGENVTLIVQLELPFKIAPQVVVLLY